MAQHDYVIANGTGAAVRSDLNNALAAIVSQNSGATAPATTYAFQFWADTTTGLLKLRNSANSAWVTLFQLDGEWSTLPVENGTAAAPSIYFKDSGTDTGFYSPGTDQVAISTGGTGRLFINSSGSVGIGTSSPDSILDVEGAAPTITLNDTNGTNDRATIQSTGGALIITARDGNADGEIIFRKFDGTTTDETLRITNTGNVGIGTTAPLATIEITGSGECMRIQSTTAGANYITHKHNSSGDIAYIGAAGGGALGSGTNTDYAIRANQGALLFATNGNNERARIDSSGRLLVGTSSSASSGDGQYCRLQVQGNTSNSAGSGIIALERGEAATSITTNETLGAVLFTDSAGNSFAEITAQADNNAGAGDYPGRLLFSTTADGASSPTERMRIRNNGTVMIGATTVPSPGGPSTNTFVASTSANDGGWTGIFQSTGASSNRGVVVSYSGASPNDGFNEPFFFQDSTTPRFYVTSNGGVKNYSANNANLSDRNVKKDITPAAGTWDCIKEWEIVNYRYQDQPDDADLNLGVIAQQVAESCPEVVTVFEKAKDDQPEKLGVKEQQMYWMAIKALQEAQVRIEQLEATNADLLARVSALESA